MENTRDQLVAPFEGCRGGRPGTEVSENDRSNGLSSEPQGAHGARETGGSLPVAASSTSRRIANLRLHRRLSAYQKRQDLLCNGF